MSRHGTETGFRHRGGLSTRTSPAPRPASVRGARHGTETGFRQRGGLSCDYLKGRVMAGVTRFVLTQDGQPNGVTRGHGTFRFNVSGIGVNRTKGVLATI